MKENIIDNCVCNSKICAMCKNEYKEFNENLEKCDKTKYIGKGKVIGGKLFCRKGPNKSYEAYGLFQNSSIIPIYFCNKSGWYQTFWRGCIAYVMAKYVLLLNKEFISCNRFLSMAEMQVNAEYILNYLLKKSWSKNAICAMLGNMQVESTINPGIWQSCKVNNKKGGYGLVQWTPSYKYINWAKENNLEISNINSQLKRIEYELANSLQWYSTRQYPMSFFEFSKSEKSPYYLACAFLRNYERPARYNFIKRGRNAEYWYKILK